MYGTITYQTIRPPELLVYTQHFCDKDGNLEKPPFLSTWPDRLLTTVIFSEEGPQDTRVTVTWEIFGEATEAERQTFHDAKTGMTGGWTGSFDKLESILGASPRNNFGSD